MLLFCSCNFNKKDEGKIIFKKATFFQEDLNSNYKINLLDLNSKIICSNNNLVPNSFSGELFDLSIDNNTNGFSVNIDEVSKKASLNCYYSFSVSDDLITLNLDTIINSYIDYENSESSYNYLKKGILLTKEDFGKISFCNFKVNSQKIKEQISFEKINFKKEEKLFFKNYAEAISKYRKGNKEILLTEFTLEKMARLIYKVPIYSRTIVEYNNIGYFLLKERKNKEAIFILGKVINSKQDRAVAYLNLADAYWVDKQIKLAKKAYSNYLILMESQGKNLKKIPERVFKRIDS